MKSCYVCRVRDGIERPKRMTVNEAILVSKLTRLVQDNEAMLGTPASFDDVYTNQLQLVNCQPTDDECVWEGGSDGIVVCVEHAVEGLVAMATYRIPVMPG